MSGKSHSFEYKLTYDESYETFYRLAFRWSRRAKIAAGAALAGIAAVLMLVYYLDPRKTYDIYLAIIAILLLFYLIYMPTIKARSGASKVAKVNGKYKLTITADGGISAPDTQGVIDLAEDKTAKVYETSKSFVIRADGTKTYCLPKRVMSEEETAEVREILKNTGYLK